VLEVGEDFMAFDIARRLPVDFQMAIGPARGQKGPMADDVQKDHVVQYKQ
jgi:hypothetical protein